MVPDENLGLFDSLDVKPQNESHGHDLAFMSAVPVLGALDTAHEPEQRRTIMTGLRERWSLRCSLWQHVAPPLRRLMHAGALAQLG